MSVKVEVLTKTYTNETTGEITPYKRLGLVGYIGGQKHTLEIKLTASELIALNMLLASDEEKPEVTSRHLTNEESDSFLKNRSNDSDQINLNEDSD